MRKIIIIVVLFLLNFTNYYKVNIIMDNYKEDFILIDKINLQQNIASYKNSTVDENIIFLKESNFDKDFYILAAHSGNSKTAYFKNIYKLNKNDDILLFINGKNLKFKVEKIYYVKKTGNIILPVDSEDTLYLTTCDKSNKRQQLIIKCVKTM